MKIDIYEVEVFKQWHEAMSGKSPNHPLRVSFEKVCGKWVNGEYYRRPALPRWRAKNRSEGSPSQHRILAVLVVLLKRLRRWWK